MTCKLYSSFLTETLAELHALLQLHNIPICAPKFYRLELLRQSEALIAAQLPAFPFILGVWAREHLSIGYNSISFQSCLTHIKQGNVCSLSANYCCLTMNIGRRCPQVNKLKNVLAVGGAHTTAAAGFAVEEPWPGVLHGRDSAPVSHTPTRRPGGAHARADSLTRSRSRRDGRRRRN